MAKRKAKKSVPYKFTPVPVELIDRLAQLDVGLQEFGIIVAILRHTNWQSQSGRWPFISIEKTLAPKLGIDQRRVRVWTAELERKGLLRKLPSSHSDSHPESRGRSVTWDLSPLFQRLGIEFPNRTKTSGCEADLTGRKRQVRSD